jgi:hypothetical protein
VGGAGAVHELGRDWETSARGKVAKESRGKGIYGVWSPGKRRGSGAHALPDQGAAKLRGSNTGIHFINNNIHN